MLVRICSKDEDLEATCHNSFLSGASTENRLCNPGETSCNTEWLFQANGLGAKLVSWYTLSEVDAGLLNMALGACGSELELERHIGTLGPYQWKSAVMKLNLYI